MSELVALERRECFMDTFWSSSLVRRYDDVLSQFESALHACPDELWIESIWTVHPEHPFVLPVRRLDPGFRPELPDAELIQVFSEFWCVAYHALYFLDLYLSGGADLLEQGFVPPEPFANEQDAGEVPRRVYSRDELLAYLEHGREKAHRTIGSLTTEDAGRPIGPEGGQVPYAEHLLGNLSHVDQHGAQLNMFLGQRRPALFAR